ncbi:MAG TPA: methylenetetrahydrofolate reductase [NAD(P)H] [Pirellulales bacterium]|jgi:methylenetetrahydrofolate reductase (NADPH)|nr:methylenetetrahydrofolate reductase [NAD(P)H] [Pirellulales bacterium]
MTLRSTYGPEKFALSFELFPPKTPAGEEELFRHLPELAAFEPGYVTCTYGAGGSTRDKTLEIVSRVRREFGVPVASHLTCVGATIDDLRGYLAEAQRQGIENIVALRGDPPRGQTGFQAVDGGFRYAHELVALVRREFSDFGIAVAGYPEVHQEAESPQADLDHLKFKVDCGADVVITQLFYDNDDFFRFEQRCRRAGIRVPIVPGVLPITNLAQVRRITAMCGARLPADLVAALETHEDSVDEQFEIGVDHATRQVQGLLDARVPGIHFYVLNKSPATCRVLRAVARPA